MSMEMLRICVIFIGLSIAVAYGCVDTDQRCPTWKNYCKSNSYVVEKCKRTCRNCPVLQANCNDKDKRCSMWKNSCSKNKYVQKNCLKTCGKCLTTTVPKYCRNLNNNCRMWSQRGECRKNPRYMLVNCKQSCGLCYKQPTSKPKVTRPKKKTTVPNVHCRNRNKNCDAWFKRGECTKNPRYMHLYCKKSCDLCGIIPTTKPRITRPTKKTHTPATTTKKTIITKKPGRKLWTCGVNIFNNPFVNFVVGGSITNKNKWIWQAAIYYYDQYICGGTLVNKQYIVTASHCVNDYGYMKDREGLDVVLGDWDRESQDGTEQKFSVEKVWSHPMYYKTQLDFDNDIAVLKLSKPAVLKRSVNEACLPSKSEKLPIDSKCFISGWGKLSAESTVVTKLQDVQLPLVSNTECAKKNKDPNGASLISENMLCAGSPKENKGSCGGDSGGPLVCKNSKNQWVLQGAVSWGSSFCDSRVMYPVFARVSKYVDWIEKVMAE